ncbi:MAG: transposase [Gammaproteobacteria bacterium]
MARNPRQHLPGCFYHVILRGNARRNIFNDTTDRTCWEEFIRDGLETHQHRILAYCWMTNHIHMLVQVGNLPLGGFIGTLASRYAKAFNKKYERCGHLFERRYRAPLVATDNYLLELVRYIHQNPLRANMVSAVGEYSWSSHSDYVTGGVSDFVCTRVVLALFSSNVQKARQQYAHFVSASPSQSDIDKFRRGEDECEDKPVDHPLIWTPASDGNTDHQETLDQLIERICRFNKVSEEDLRSPSRMREHTKVRAIIALEAFDCGIATVTEIANRFNRSQPGLSRAMNRLRRERNKL